MSDNPTDRILARLDAIQAELNRTRSDIMERIDRLQSRIDVMDEHLTMGLGHSDRVERRAAAISEDNRLLGEMLMSLTRIVRRLEGRIGDIEGKDAA